MGGVNPKEAQSLARHSVITLTMDRYTHQYAGNLTAALNVLPDLSTPTNEVAKAMGTDGENPSRQHPVFSVSPPVSLEGAVSSSLVESCGVDKQMSAIAESPGKTGRNHTFIGGNEVMSALGLEPKTYGLKVRCSTN